MLPAVQGFCQMEKPRGGGGAGGKLRWQEVQTGWGGGVGGGSCIPGMYKRLMPPTFIDFMPSSNPGMTCSHA